MVSTHVNYGKMRHGHQSVIKTNIYIKKKPNKNNTRIICVKVPSVLLNKQREREREKNRERERSSLQLDYSKLIVRRPKNKKRKKSRKPRLKKVVLCLLFGVGKL